MNTKPIRSLAISAFLGLAATGCAPAELGDNSAGDDAEVAVLQQAVSGTVSFDDCTDSEQTKIRTAIRYLYRRVTDGSLSLAMCLEDGVLSDSRGYDGREIADMLKKDVVTHVKCAELARGDDWVTNAQAPVSVRGESLTIDPDFVANSHEVRVAGVIAHEIMHNRGFRHDDEVYYSNSVPEQVEACIANRAPFAAVDTGYALYWDGKRVGYQASWSRERGANNCQWNKDTYPDKKVECYYDGETLGYVLYWDGKRAGFDPTWTRERGVENCKWNRENNPEEKVSCTFNGQPLGYQLFRDGNLAGYAPEWSKTRAASNCKWNQETYPDMRVECYFDGAALGYELYWDGKRVGMEPTWSQNQGQYNCQWNRNTYGSTKIVECTYDGIPL